MLMIVQNLVSLVMVLSNLEINIKSLMIDSVDHLSVSVDSWVGFVHELELLLKDSLIVNLVSD